MGVLLLLHKFFAAEIFLFLQVRQRKVTKKLFLKKMAETLHKQMIEVKQLK